MCREEALLAMPNEKLLPNQLFLTISLRSFTCQLITYMLVIGQFSKIKKQRKSNEQILWCIHIGRLQSHYITHIHFFELQLSCGVRGQEIKISCSPLEILVVAIAKYHIKQRETRKVQKEKKKDLSRQTVIVLFSHR